VSKKVNIKLRLGIIIHAVSSCLHLERKISERFYGVCHWNPGSSETSISLLITAQPRSESTFPFFPSAHLISACLSLFFIPRSYLQRNASLSLSLFSIALCSSLWIPLLWFPLSFSRFYSFFVLEAADHLLYIQS